MDKNTHQRLREILNERRKNMQSIREFDDLFYKFSRRILMTSAIEISRFLEQETGDFLKIFKDDPIKFNNARYFAMVVLNSRVERRMVEFLSNESNPSLKFEGQEINGRVVVSQKLIDDKEFKEIGIYQIIDLNEKITSELLVNFIENVFK